MTKRCSKCKQVKNLDDFHRCNKSLDGRHYICKECKKTYDLIYKKNRKEYFQKKGKKYYQEHKEKIKERVKEGFYKFRKNNPERYRLIVKKSRDKKRKWFNELKKTMKCEICGESDYICLDFHHKNPKDKDITVARIFNNRKDKILKEISKCQVLCANCHRKVHRELRKM